MKGFAVLFKKNYGRSLLGPINSWCPRGSVLTWTPLLINLDTTHHQSQSIKCKHSPTGFHTISGVDNNSCSAYLVVGHRHSNADLPRWINHANQAQNGWIQINIEIMNNHDSLVEALTALFCSGLVVCTVNRKIFCSTAATWLPCRRLHHTYSKMATRNFVQNIGTMILLYLYFYAHGTTQK